jgi:hypothetical protein
MSIEDKVLRAYYVWPRFPSISMSGEECLLGCRHCNRVYIKDMLSISDPQELLETCKMLANKGAIGFLLSGGCDKEGRMLNLEKMLPTLKKIKRETELIVKLHTGLVNKDLAEEIVSAEIDIASVEVVGCKETLEEIFHFKKGVKPYERTLQNLERAGMPYIVPHLCIGLYYGKLKGEFRALEIIKNSCTPSSIVMIIFTPTTGTPLSNCKVPSLQDISSVIRKAKEMFPHRDISLGCMRPRLPRFRERVELTALNSGVTRIEIPSKRLLIYAKNKGYTIKNINACCALPEELEERAC